MRRAIPVSLWLLSLAALIAAAEGWAQNGSAISQNSASAAGDSGSSWLSEILLYVREQQREFHRALVTALRHLRENARLETALSLIGFSFLYGVLHAAGPGHGKIILSTYLATHESRIGRGVILSVAAAFLQGIVAIAIVGLVVGAFGRLARDTAGTVQWMERGSYALIMGFGGILTLRAGQGLIASYRQQRPVLHSHPGHHHFLAEGSHCSHRHAPAPSDLTARKNLTEAIAVILAIGIRPCSGAVLSLSVALALGMFGAGIAAVFAMSTGTAATVAVLALIAVYFRRMALRIVGRQGSMRYQRLIFLLAGLGGVVIIGAGFVLFFASWIPVHPLGVPG